jgi:hypothetical protein
MLDEQLQELAPAAPTRSITGAIDEHALRKGRASSCAWRVALVGVVFGIAGATLLIVTYTRRKRRDGRPQ